MKKLILKTALITLASILCVFLLVFGALALFSPITLANLFDRMGGYSSSIHFYESQYDKTGDIDDLSVLVLKIDHESDSELAEEYLAELVSHKDFNEFCVREEGGEISNKEFYYGKYAVALAKNSKLDKSIEVANAFVEDNGYTNYNPFSILLMEYGENLSETQLTELGGHIIKHSGDNLDKVAQDLKHIDNLKSKI